MRLKKYKLGELIELSEEKNSEGLYGIENVRGISNAKEIMSTKANVDEFVIRKFYIVSPNQFIYNPRTTRMGDKVGLAYNNTDKPLLFSFNNIAFKIKDSAKKQILPQYLYMYYNRCEFDRYAITNSWGSATELFSFEEMCDIDITLPSIEQQRKYVNIYLALQSNLAAYQSKVDELKLVCDGYIEELRRKMPSERIGEYIFRYSEKNTEKAINDVVGLSTEKKFRVAQSRVNRNELGGYKIVHPLDIAYVPTTDTWKVLAFAVNHFEKDVVVSPIYEVFATKGKLKSDYLAIWLKREEFDRYARYNSWGSARENFTFEEMQEVRIPIPDESVQQAIIDLYLIYEDRKAIATQLKEQLSTICPVLIQGSLEE